MIPQLQVREATIEDLYKVEGKAEIVNGKVVLMPPTGDDPGRAGFEIAVHLRQHERETGLGRAYSDNVGFNVLLPNRKSFSPDAAFFTGQPAGMKFLEGSPDFAAEVRSENDYGNAAEREIAKKRADYFAAGTLVVWDVDLLGEDVIKSYHADDPENPTIFRRGEIANAEPAVPG
ncbi:MAG: Uma2 family endonuclease, partial [Blastocatellia bacterium]